MCNWKFNAAKILLLNSLALYHRCTLSEKLLPTRWKKNMFFFIIIILFFQAHLYFVFTERKFIVKVVLLFLLLISRKYLLLGMKSGRKRFFQDSSCCETQLQKSYHEQLSVRNKTQQYFTPFRNSAYKKVLNSVSSMKTTIVS